MTIGVIGAGRLGLCFSLLAAHAGYDVHISDVRPDYLSKLKDKSLKSNEPDVESLLSITDLSIHDSNQSLIDSADLIFTFVATPSLENGSYDLTAINSVLDDFKRLSLIAQKP